MKKRAARIFQPTPRNLAYLAARLRAGELVAVPTETVYGLAANAMDEHACRKIFRAKGRPSSDPLIVHIRSLAQLPLLCEPNPAALRLAKKFWPGPLTLVLPKKVAVPDVVSAGRPSVAIRMPHHPVFRKLLRLANLPLAAPSANRFGYVSPTTSEHVRLGLGTRISYILEGGACSLGLESTIVDLRDPRRPRLLRPGIVTQAEIEAVLQLRVGRLKRSTRAEIQNGQLAPGLLKRHYSPNTPVSLHSRLRTTRALATPREAFLFTARPTAAADNIFWLDAQGHLSKAARRLFAMLRQLDRAGFNCIHVELVRGGGLADAINDRLRRAAAR